MSKKVYDKEGKELGLDSEGRLLLGPIHLTDWIKTSPLILEALTFLVRKYPCECPSECWNDCSRCRLVQKLENEQ